MISISRVFLFSHNCFTPKKNKLRLVSSSFCSLVNVFLKRDCKNQHKPPQEYSQEITKNEGNWKILFLLSKKKGVNYLIETFWFYKINNKYLCLSVGLPLTKVSTFSSPLFLRPLVTILTLKSHAFLPRNPCILTVSLSDSAFGLLFKLIQSNLHVAVLCNMVIPRKFRIYVSVDEQSLRKSWIFQRIRILKLK